MSFTKIIIITITIFLMFHWTHTPKYHCNDLTKVCPWN